MDTTGHRRTPTDHGDKTQDQQTFPSPNERLVFLFFFYDHILGPGAGPMM